MVDVGSKVKKGDPLVLLDARDAQYRAASANAAVEQARARLAIESGKKLDPESVPDVRAAKQARDLAVADAERAQKMFENNAISQAEWDAVRTRAESARAQYDAAVVGVKATVAAVEAAAAQAAIASKGVADSTIRAPFDGAVAERRISTGEYANVGRVVAVVVRTNPLRLQFDVPESEVPRVEVGKTVQIRVAAFNDKLFTGAVKRIGASVKTTSRTMPVEAEFPNDDGTLKPGLFAQGELTLGGNAQPALLVPLTAISSSGSNSRVFVKSAGKVQERLVKLGRQVGNKVEIFGAVTAQDEVATDNIDKLSDGLEYQP
ncbi:MAG: efflux RND transporter periplasmic adaptor subunit [Polyangiaceae bacterium]